MVLIDNKTPSVKAKEITYDFYKYIGFYPQARDCAVECVNKIIESLERNNGFTQCVIDIDYWNAVKVEIEFKMNPLNN